MSVILLELDASDFSVKHASIFGNSQVMSKYDGDWRSVLANKYYYMHGRLGSLGYGLPGRRGETN